MVWKIRVNPFSPIALFDDNSFPTKIIVPDQEGGLLPSTASTQLELIFEYSLLGFGPGEDFRVLFNVQDEILAPGNEC